MKNIKYTVLALILLFETSIIAQVVINEVQYDPPGVDTGNEWIEVKNIGAGPITMAGYDINATSGDYYTFPALFTVPASAFVIIHWRTVGVDDFDFSDNVAHLYTGTSGYTANMGNTTGWVALFNSTTHSSATIIDYMEYGAGGLTWESSAVTAGIWTAGDFASDVVEGHSLEYDGSGDAGTDWFDQSTPTDNALPVELSSFTAESVRDGVLLKWTTESEIENLGFMIERKVVSGRMVNGEWNEIVSYKTDDTLLGQGTVSFATNYEYTDKLVQQGNTYEYRLADVDYNGVITYHATREVFVESSPLVVTSAKNFTVIAYPNPFNPSTTIRYSIPTVGARHVLPLQVNIYDITGKLITTLVNKEQPAGWYEIQWNGTNQNDGKEVPGGAYLSRVTVGDEVKTNKLILLR
ncbi:MAG: T9SS type A sorting domain-containing protein [Planctomycetia bacterium]|nr:T9SS type A sorting domain-containing protein [Planctomycetia bacterium]